MQEELPPGGRTAGVASRAARRNSCRAQLPVLLLAVLLAGLASGCSVRKLAVNKLGNALASSGTTFARDDDPDLVAQAVPFSLKLMESLLAESPNHKGLLFATASGFTQYAYAFVQQEADETEDKDLAAATRLRARAKRLYLRARNYGLRGLEASHPGFERRLHANPPGAAREATPREVPLLYWTAVSWGAAVALAKDDPELIGEMPQVEALIDRALALDERWDAGAIHGFLITYETVRPGATGDPAQRSRAHFDRAVTLSGGRLASPYVAYAEAVCVQQQDARQFDALIEKALAINPDQDPDHRLVNLIMQRRARWLRSKRDDLFLLPDKPAGK